MTVSFQILKISFWDISMYYLSHQHELPETENECKDWSSIEEVFVVLLGYKKIKRAHHVKIIHSLLYSESNTSLSTCKCSWYVSLFCKIYTFVLYSMINKQWLIILYKVYYFDWARRVKVKWTTLYILLKNEWKGLKLF